MASIIKRRPGAVVLAGALAAAFALLPACGAHRDDRMHRESVAVDEGEVMSMMHHCREQAEEARETAEQMARRLAEVEEADDPERMRAVLAEAREAFERIETHMDSCATMMEDIERRYRERERVVRPEPRAGATRGVLVRLSPSP